MYRNILYYILNVMQWYKIRKVFRIENYIKQREYHIINKHDITYIINKYHCKYL